MGKITRINLTDLPPKARKQIEDKLGTAPKRSKYGNVPTVVNGIRFSSKKEANRYSELMLLRKAGRIIQLRLQPSFTLTEAFITPDGERIGASRYVADFSYVDTETGEYVVEDVKGVRTAVYLQKKKQMLDKYDIRIKEI